MAIHAARGKASPSPKGSGASVKPAAQPRCGPQAFDMLRQMDKTRVLAHGEEVDELADFGRDAGHVATEDDGDVFVVPMGSDASGVSGEQERLAEVEVAQPDMLPGRTRPMLLAGGALPKQPSATSLGTHPQPPTGANSDTGVKIAGVGSSGGPGVSHAGTEEHESAADYVERVKRSLGMGAPAPCASETPASASSTPSGRTRSSDPRSAVAKARAINPTGVRARSSDPKTAATVARASDLPVDSDDDSDDGSVALPGKGSSPWKADVRSMVQEFAREERGRAGARGGGSGVAAKASPSGLRPPKAPAPSSKQVADCAVLERRRPADFEGEKKQGEHPGEQLFFSRRPRDVEYTPATVDEYKQKFDKKEYGKLGSLGPDLDDDNLLVKKAVQEKVKQFSKELQRVNRHRSESRDREMQPRAEPKPAEPKPNARAKMLEFAKKVPKPRPDPRARAAAAEEKVAKEAPSEPKGPTEAEKASADLEEICRREKQHFQDVVKVQDVKDFLCRIAA